MKKTIQFKETGGRGRKGKIIFYEGKESDKVKRIRPRTTRNITKNLQSMPFNPNLYQLNKFAVPRMNYVQTEQVKEDNEKLKALELGLLAQIADQFNQSARIKREQEELKKIQRNEQQEEAFLNNQLELFELREKSDKLNDQLKNVIDEMNTKNKIIEVIKKDAEDDKNKAKEQLNLQNEMMARYMTSLQQKQQQEMDLLKSRNIEENRLNQLRDQQQQLIISEQARQIGQLQANQKKRANLTYQVKTDVVIPESQKREMGMTTEAPQMISSGVGTEKISQEVGTQVKPQVISSGFSVETSPTVIVARPRMVQTKITEFAPGFVRERVSEIEKLIPQLTETQLIEKEGEVLGGGGGGGAGGGGPVPEERNINVIKKNLINAINEKRGTSFKLKGKSLIDLKVKALKVGISQGDINKIIGKN